MRHRHSSRARTAVLCAMLAVGCGTPEQAQAPAPPAPAPIAPSVAPSAPEALPTPPPPLAPPTALTAPPTLAAPVAPVALADDGLPPITTGPAIRLESLPSTTREVGRRHVPQVTVSDPATQTALDAWFEEHAWCHGRAQLVLEGLVSYPCEYSEPAASAGVARAAMNVRFDAATGAVATLEPSEVFLPGTDLRAMVRVWTDENVGGELAFGPTGAIVVPADFDEELVRIPWRTIAPYVRADGPLGPALVAAGLTLAPPGTTAPSTPAEVDALRFGDRREAMAFATRLTADVRARARLRVTDDGAMLVGTDGGGLELPRSIERRRSHLYGPLAELVPARISRAVDVHDGAGPRTDLVGFLPAGTSVIAARGSIGARTSELGASWVLIATPAGAGYVQGRDVVEADACGAPGSASTSGSFSGFAELATDRRFVWTVEPASDGQSSVTLFPITSDCAIGAEARRVVVDGAVSDLRVVQAAPEGDAWLLAVVAAVDRAAPARIVSVFGEACAPLYTTTLDAPTLRLAERRGPDRAAGYFPIAITAGDARVWLSWDGTELHALTP